MLDVRQEIRYAIRGLAKSPAFSIVAVLSLALGIGVNTAVLAVCRAVLLTPLPVPHPSQLVVAYWTATGVTGVMERNSGGAQDPRTGKGLSSNFSYSTYLALRESVRDRADLCAFTFLRQANVSAGVQPVMGAGMLVSGNYFQILGVPMAAGRGLLPDDDRDDAEPAAVIGFGLWQRAFGGDRAAIGRSIKVNGQPFTIVGVTARDYFGVSNGGFFPPADLTLPLHSQPRVAPTWARPNQSLFDSETTLWLRIMGRLRSDHRASVESGLTAAFARQLAGSSAPSLRSAAAPSVRLIDGARGVDSMRRTFEQPLMLLAGVAGLVFVIACVNIASLVLVRGVARQQEFWIRLALGAGRARLLFQTIIESVLLAVAGGGLGVLLAVWSAQLIVVTLAGSWPHALSIQVDGTLILTGLGVSLLAAALFGVLPALRLARRESADLMRQTGAGAPRLRGGTALVLVQVAVAVPLVAGAALFLRTLHNLAAVDLGFQPQGLVMFRMDPTLNGYDEAEAKQLYERVLNRVEQVPGVRGATLMENALVSGWVSNTSFSVDGGQPAAMLMNRVGPGFFESIGLAVVAGRGLGVQDDGSSARVGVINQAGARKFFGNVNAVGRSVYMGRTGRTPIEIVGIARDSRYDSLRKQPQPIIYLPYYQSTGLGSMFVAVRTEASASMEAALRRAVAEVDPEVPITDFKTQARQIDETIGGERAFTLLLVSFGIFALGLACIGLHGVTAYAVARRTNEIGIRLALGAQRRSVLWLVLRQVVLLAGGGLVIGIPAAIAASRTVRAFLFEVEPGDPWSIGVGASILLIAAIAGGFVPARRASRLDPLVALRRD
jgi:predicted permease